MNFKKSLFLIIFLCSITPELFSQTVFNVEYVLGKTSPANVFFPELKVNQTLSLSIGKKHFSDDAWVQSLQNPETGLLFQYSNYGNNEFVGSSYSLMPYLEIPLFYSKTRRLSLNSAIGASYFNKNYDDGINWQNKAVSTDFTWAYRMFLNYSIFNNKSFETRATVGYSHHSNGHVKWPNQGLNTFSLGLNFKFNTSKTPTDSIPTKETKYAPVKFYHIKAGIGQQSIYRLYNDTKEVYSTSFSYGKIYKNTYKVSLGFFYTFYESYYDYINEEGFLVNEEYPELKENPVYNASAYGIFLNGELLMNHFAVEAQIGFNIDKPFYKIDYRLNSEIYVPETGDYVPNELDSYYTLKRYISGKLGLKYYVWNTKNMPKHNLSLGAYICSNLGQADYSELSLGYTYIIK
jgi:hypothetical protein